jgi:hypothetical protein
VTRHAETSSLAACFCGVVGLYDAFYVWSLSRRAVCIGPASTSFFPDFLVFQPPCRAFVEARLDRSTTSTPAPLPERVYRRPPAGEVRFRPFFYPPTGC